MDRHQRRARMLLGGALSWVAMVGVCTICWVSLIGYRGQGDPDATLLELALLFPFVVSAPFALACAVYLPLLIVARRVLGADRRGLLALAGALSAPVVAIVLLMALNLIWPPARTIAEDFRYTVSHFRRDPVYAAPWGIALLVGGVISGIAVAEPRPRRDV